MKNKALHIILTIIVLSITGFVLWGLSPLSAEAAALDAWGNDESVVITEQNGNFFFTAVGQTKEVGIIFYPGGHVDPRAYSQLLREIAADGYPVVLVPMPLNLAVLGSQKADAIIQDFPEIETWVIAGHSVGGAMAASYTEKHTDLIDGLILWASYPAGSVDLSETEIAAISITGSLDGISSPEEIENAKPNLPKDTIYFEIIGGNHAQFGSYGWQSGDLEAEISAAEQQSIVIAATKDFLATIP